MAAMESEDGPLTNAGVKSNADAQPQLLVVQNDVSDDLKDSKKHKKKRVSFMEPLAIKIDVSVPNDAKDDVFDEVISTKKQNNHVTFSNKVSAAKDDVIKIPEISELWWGEIDDGDAGEPKTQLELVRLFIRNFIDHIAVRVFGIFLIFLDIVLLIVDLAIGDKPDVTQLIYDSIALTLSCVFMVDLLLRIFSYGPRNFFRSKWEVIDGVVIIVTFSVTIFYTAIDNSDLDPSSLGRLVSFARLIRVVRVIRIVYSHRHVTESGRRTVSQNKRRYRKDGFDLDLTYVTDNVIAMSFPSSGFQSFYRNPREEVRRFFQTKHPGRYKVYNLCSERGYEPELFEHSVYRVMIDDHNVPAIPDLMSFIDDAREWMSADQDHVMAIHCKGGKGRTGTIVCSWLIDSGKFQTATEALEYFGMRRTDMKVGETFQGVETASQIRYVGYFEKIKRDFAGNIPPTKNLKIKKIIINSIAGVGRGNGSDLMMQILSEKEEVIRCHFGEEHNCKIAYDEKDNRVACDIIDCPILSGDIKFRFTSSSKNLPRGYDDCAFYFWLNTGFVDGDHVTLSRAELDNPHKKKTWHIFTEDFSVEVYFDDQ